MPGSPRDFAQHIASIPQHASPLPPESGCARDHYRRAANDANNLLAYFGRNIQGRNFYATVYERHAGRLGSFALFTLVEAFERYVKEVAACCVDHVAPLVLDDRLDDFKVTARSFAAHFEEESLGKAICEQGTWLDCKAIKHRFKKLLADPFKPGKFDFLPRAPRPRL